MNEIDNWYVGNILLTHGESNWNLNYVLMVQYDKQIVVFVVFIFIVDANVQRTECLRLCISMTVRNRIQYSMCHCPALQT